VEASLWNRCLRLLESEIPEQQFNTWVRPLQAVEENGVLKLLAPNRFVVDWLTQNLRTRIEELMDVVAEASAPQIQLEVGSRAAGAAVAAPVVLNGTRARRAEPIVTGGRLNPDFTFANFVEGKSNQLAKAAAQQVGENPGRAYNPLFIYGGVGLGKTHLMHAVANMMRA
jgi:chromosomal replication initiator protein